LKFRKQAFTVPPPPSSSTARAWSCALFLTRPLILPSRFRSMRFSVAFIFVFFLATISLVLSAPILEPRYQYSGRGTWFDVGMGNCGQESKPSDHIVALATGTYDHGAHCGKSVVITDTKSKKTATATVMDSCPSCAEGDLDMSTSLFEEFADLGVGVLQIGWNFE